MEFKVEGKYCLPSMALDILSEVNTLMTKGSFPHGTLQEVFDRCNALFKKLYDVWPDFNINEYYMEEGMDKRTFLNIFFFRNQNSTSLDMNRACVEWLKMLIYSNKGIDFNKPLVQKLPTPFSCLTRDGVCFELQNVRPLEIILATKGVLSLHERQQVFKIILEHESTNVNLATTTNYSILYMAMKHPPYYVKELLAKKQTDVNGRLGIPSTPLLFALESIVHLQETSPWFYDLVQYPSQNIMQLLEHSECDVSRKNTQTGFSAILLAAMIYGNFPNIFDRILEIDPNEIYAVARDGTNLFFIAVLREDNSLLKKLLEVYADMRFKRVMTTALCLDSFSSSKLSKNLARATEFLAGFCPQGPTLNDTLKKPFGAEDFYRDYVGATVVHIAIARNNPPLLDILLNTDGYDVDLSIKYKGETALEMATRLNRSNCITILSQM